MGFCHLNQRILTKEAMMGVNSVKPLILNQWKTMKIWMLGVLTKKKNKLNEFIIIKRKRLAKF